MVETGNDYQARLRLLPANTPFVQKYSWASLYKFDMNHLSALIGRRQLINVLWQLLGVGGD